MRTHRKLRIAITQAMSAAGVEPTTCWLRASYSDLLSYADKSPLFVTMTSARLERAISCFADRCSIQVELRGRYSVDQYPQWESNPQLAG